MSKENAPAFQFYAADYLSDGNVGIMTIEDEGCYIRLLAYCWREGSIPNDPELQARLCKGIVPSRVVQGCFNHPSQDGTRLLHPRLEKERDVQRQWREKSARGGRASAHKRKGTKDKSPQQGGCQMVPTKRQPKGNSSSSSSSSNNIYKAGRRAPSNFVVTDELKAWAEIKAEGVDIKSETEAFMDHQYKDIKTDWNACWRTWMRNAPNFKRPDFKSAQKTFKPDTVGKSTETKGLLTPNEIKRLAGSNPFADLEELA
jgi:uncharacterized protein YdaU (DUF1376 family)